MWRSLVPLVALVALAGARRGLGYGLYHSEIKLLHKSAGENDLQPARPFVILDGQCTAEISQELCKVSGLGVAVAEAEGAPLLETRSYGGELVPRVQVYRADCEGPLRVDVRMACEGEHVVGRRQRRAIGAPRALPPVASGP